MTTGEETLLPTSLRDAIRIEYARTFAWPYETLITLSVNAILVIVGWFFMPPVIEELMFTNHRPMAFAVVMAVWMYSDVPSTNQPGSDATRFLAALDDPPMLHRLLWARRFVIWSIVTPVAGIASVWLGIERNHLTAALFGFVWIVVVPFGVLAITPLFGLRWPYHPIPLRERWAHRSEWRRFGVRWLILVLFPYAWVPAIGIALTIPSLVVWGVSIKGTFPTDLSAGRFALGTAVGIVVTGLAIRIGTRWTSTIVRLRRDELRRELADPDLG